MRQYRDRLQLRTRREPPVPPIEAFPQIEGVADKWIVILSLFSMGLILLLAFLEAYLGTSL